MLTLALHSLGATRAVPGVTEHGTTSPTTDLATLARNEAVALLPLTASESRSAAKAALHDCDTYGTNGMWPDLVTSGAYNTSAQRTNWPASIHVERAKAMALAAADDSGPQAGNLTLLRCADRALRSWAKLDLQDANWWWNEIGVPMFLADALLLMKHAGYGASSLDPLVAACSGCRTCLDRAVGGAMTGANLVWLSHVAMQAALLRGNATRVGECVGYIYAEVRLSPRGGDGVMADGSFHQHGPQLLLGSYGASFASSIGRIASNAARTRWALPNATLAVLTGLLLDGDAWATDADGSSFDWQVVGREVARKGSQGAMTGYDPAVLRALGGKSNPRAAELEAFARRIEARGNATASRLAPPLLGHRAFYESDYAVQRGVRTGTRTGNRDGDGDGYGNGTNGTTAVRWALSVHMRSNRTIGAACVNGEGVPTEHASDGVTAIHVAGGVGQWGAPNASAPAFPALDWQRLPGLTAEVNPALLAKCDARLQKTPPWRTSFVGSVSDGDGGASAIDLWSHNLTAARAYFLSAEEGLLALGARVRVNSTNPAITTIDVRRYDLRVGGHAVVSTGGGDKQPPRRLNVSSEPVVWRGGGGSGETWWLWYDRVGYVVVDDDAAEGAAEGAEGGGDGAEGAAGGDGADGTGGTGGAGRVATGGDGAAGTVSVTLSERSADWRAVSESLSGTFTLPLLQIELSDIVGGAFVYRVIPGVASPEEMPALAAAGRGGGAGGGGGGAGGGGGGAGAAGGAWFVLRNTARLQLVARGDPSPLSPSAAAGDFAMKAVFWEAGTYAGGEAAATWPTINVSAPCLLMLRSVPSSSSASSPAGGSGAVELVLSSPDNRGGPRLRVRLAGLAGLAGGPAGGGLDCGPSGTATADGAIVDVLLPTGDAMGRSTRVRCTPSGADQTLFVA